MPEKLVRNADKCYVSQISKRNSYSFYPPIHTSICTLTQTCYIEVIFFSYLSIMFTKKARHERFEVGKEFKDFSFFF